VRDEVEIPLGLRLGGEVVLPVPLLEHLVRERVAVLLARRVERAPRIPVPVPGAADAVAFLEALRREARFPEEIELIEPAETRADDDRIELGGRSRAGHRLPP